ncbi:MAG: hypothetical protein IKS64_00500 [Muribaculaceae bacterium]|nr:hypothetical protein [Muribaculaceae bacterium]MBR6431315.1 hypothetical protein [Muribaculaceae bacterium]
MHIFCPNCGKHIDVSIQEIEKLEGHYVCPQCLIEIDLDIETRKRDIPLDDEATPVEKQSLPDASHINQPSTSTGSVDNSDSDEAKPDASKPKEAEKPPQPSPHVDDVIRYCRKCGAFLKEGANFCPKCGNFVRIRPPKYQSNKTTAPPPYTKNSQQNNKGKNNPPKQPMAAKNKKASSRASNGGSKSQFSILSIGGCLAFTLIVVALFFIVYIITGN